MASPATEGNEVNVTLLTTPQEATQPLALGNISLLATSTEQRHTIEAISTRVEENETATESATLVELKPESFVQIRAVGDPSFNNISEKMSSNNTTTKAAETARNETKSVTQLQAMPTVGQPLFINPAGELRIIETLPPPVAENKTAGNTLPASSSSFVGRRGALVQIRAAGAPSFSLMPALGLNSTDASYAELENNETWLAPVEEAMANVQRESLISETNSLKFQENETATEPAENTNRSEHVKPETLLKNAGVGAQSFDKPQLIENTLLNILQNQTKTIPIESAPSLQEILQTVKLNKTSDAVSVIEANKTTMESLMEKPSEFQPVEYILPKRAATENTANEMSSVQTNSVPLEKVQLAKPVEAKYEASGLNETQPIVSEETLVVPVVKATNITSVRHPPNETISTKIAENETVIIIPERFKEVSAIEVSLSAEAPQIISNENPEMKTSHMMHKLLPYNTLKLLSNVVEEVQNETLPEELPEMESKELQIPNKSQTIIATLDSIPLMEGLNSTAPQSALHRTEVPHSVNEIPSPTTSNETTTAQSVELSITNKTTETKSSVLSTSSGELRAPLSVKQETAEGNETRLLENIRPSAVDKSLSASTENETRQIDNEIYLTNALQTGLQLSEVATKSQSEPSTDLNNQLRNLVEVAISALRKALELLPPERTNTNDTQSPVSSIEVPKEGQGVMPTYIDFEHGKI